VLLKESSEEVEVRRTEIIRIEFAYKITFTISHLPEFCLLLVCNPVGPYIPLFKNILTPGGRLSIPALIASKACSYGTGLAVQVSIIKPCWMSETDY